MNKYHNVMETLVCEKLDNIWMKIDCCKCDRCRYDVIACTLNQLTPKYVVTNEGELYARLYEVTNKQDFDIVIAIIKSIKTVSENPKH